MLGPGFNYSVLISAGVAPSDLDLAIGGNSVSAATLVISAFLTGD